MGAPVSSRLSCPVKLCTENQIVSLYLGLFRLTLEHYHDMHVIVMQTNSFYISSNETVIVEAVTWS